MNVKPAKDAWDTLEKAFDDKGLNRRLQLLRKICSVKLEDYNTMQAYVNDTLSIGQQLNVIFRCYYVKRSYPRI